MKLTEIYNVKVQTNVFKPDPAQENAVQHLQRVYDALLEQQKTSHSFLSKLKFKQPKAVHGLYLYGGVGTGKTTLMDLFFEVLPFKRKLRLHFHEFMRDIHQELEKNKGHKEPLKLVAQDFAAKTDIICLDELFVNDIADAMILANLLQALLDANITLIITSNIEPDQLYRHGLQRQRFLPAIDLIKANSDIVPLDNGKDYRYWKEEQLETYYFPADAKAMYAMTTAFNELSQGHYQENVPLIVDDRAIHTLKLSPEVVWFDFRDLCSVPRSQTDYLIIAQRFHTVLLSNVPKIASEQLNDARYFINLIDIFYDQGVRLIIAAEVPVAEIYLEGRLAFEFQRTRSRLVEMQSQEYLTKHTLPK